MPNWAIAVAVAGALVAGLAANRWWARGHDDSSEEGFGVKDIVGPVTTLAVILLAFIMVEALNSYARSREDRERAKTSAARPEHSTRSVRPLSD